MSLISEVDRYVRLKRSLGYKFADNERMLRSYARFAADRDDELVRADTAIDWASRTPSAERSCVNLSVVRAFAISLHAENTRHEIPPRNVFGRRRARRTSPHLMTTAQIAQLMEVALSMIHIVLDNYATHKHEKVLAWIERKKRVFLHFIPTRSSWANLVERFFAMLTQKQVRRATAGVKMS